jgi:hypothetical protein
MTPARPAIKMSEQIMLSSTDKSRPSRACFTSQRTPPAKQFSRSPASSTPGLSAWARGRFKVVRNVPLVPPKNMTTPRSLRAASLLALLASAPAFGATYVGSAYESFDYTAGNLTNVLNGGTGWNATGDSTQANTTTWGVTLTPSGTTFTGSGPVFALNATATNQQITAGGAALIVGGTGQAGRNFGQNIDTGTFYFSFKVKKTVDAVRTVNFSLFGDNGATANPTERIAFGQIANNVSLRSPDGSADPAAATKANQGKFAVLVQAGAAQAGGTFTTGTYPAGNIGVFTAATEQNFELNQTFLIVGKIEFNYTGGNGSDDRVTYYINPASLTNESLATSYITLDKFNIGTLVGFRLFAGATSTSPAFSASAAEFDEIRLGTTFASVTTGVTAPPPTPLQIWRDSYFSALEQSDLAVGALTADPDGDGSSNLLEYALGTLPRTADSSVELVTHAAPDVFSFDYPKLRTDLTYVPETSTDLTTWTTVGVTDTLTGGAAPAYLHTATVANPGTGRVFLRLRVTNP